MRVEIVEIGEDDAFLSDSFLVGLKGTLATESVNNGFTRGKFYSDDDSGSYFFNEVKTKPIYDA